MEAGLAAAKDKLKCTMSKITQIQSQMDHCVKHGPDNLTSDASGSMADDASTKQVAI